MSPMLTHCHDERNKIRGGRFDLARKIEFDTAANTVAVVACWMNVRRFNCFDI
jgi:hypothetical protein